jgi:hypothetical protein
MRYVVNFDDIEAGVTCKSETVFESAICKNIEGNHKTECEDVVKIDDIEADSSPPYEEAGRTQKRSTITGSHGKVRGEKTSRGGRLYGMGEKRRETLLLPEDAPG